MKKKLVLLVLLVGFILFIWLMFPKISLKGDKKIILVYPEEYIEPGFKVNSLNKKIKTTIKGEVNSKELGTYEINYSAKNFIFKNSVTREVKVVDLTKPKINLYGTDEYLFLNEPYEEKGYFAFDEKDGNLTNDVKIEGSVNSTKSGIYNLIYTVSDKSNNKAKKIRKVVVLDKERTSPGCGIAGAIYLTFDDGPSSETIKILELLKKENIKATFFVTNLGSDDVLKKTYEEGHTIGLHTFSHDYSFVYSSLENYYKDLNNVSNRVERVTGMTSKIIRFPGGSSNLVSKKYSEKIMTNLSTDVILKGYKYFDWNVDSEDAGKCSKTKSAKCVENSVINNLSKEKCNMILLHDTKEYTYQALKPIIDYAKNNGYVFKQIDNTTHMVKQRLNN